MNNSWPELKFSEWQDTCATLHMWTQVVGKIRLRQTPLVNHWWNVPLYVTARGLATSVMPFHERYFEIEFDFIDHKLLIKCSDGSATALALRPQSVADFYAEVAKALASFLEARLSTPVTGLTHAQLDEQMVQAQVAPEIRARALAVLETCDMGRFAPGMGEAAARSRALDDAAAAMEAWSSR